MSLGTILEDKSLTNLRVTKTAALTGRIATDTVESKAAVSDRLAVLSGASQGLVLTSDASGNATWQESESSQSPDIIPATTTFPVAATDGIYGGISAFQVGNLVKGTMLLQCPRPAAPPIAAGTVLATVSPPPATDTTFMVGSNVEDSMQSSYIEVTRSFTISTAGVITSDTDLTPAVFFNTGWRANLYFVYPIAE